jgi:subtilisin family serine protease
MSSFTIVRLPAAPTRRGTGPIGRPLDAAAGRLRGALLVESAELEPRDIGDLSRDPTVAAFAPKMPIRLVQPLAADAPPAIDSAWGMAAVGADVSPFDGTDVLPAVLDTGIDATHPAFAGVSLEEEDFTGTGNGDAHGHGTHCAGTIFGRDVDGVRIGIARGVQRALIGKVLGPGGGGDTDAIYRAINWALDHGAQVISMSLGLDFPGYVQQLVDDEGIRPDVATSLALEAYRRNLRIIDALMRIVEVRSDLPDGAIVVAAAGNESGRDQHPPFEIGVSVPAAASGVLSVGALGPGAQGLEVAAFSNSLPVISAPGVQITSARAGGGLTTMSGTSMATPHVAGVAALWWQSLAARRGRLSASAVQASLRANATTDGLSPDAPAANYGDGLVRAP